MPIRAVDVFHSVARHIRLLLALFTIGVFSIIAHSTADAAELGEPGEVVYSTEGNVYISGPSNTHQRLLYDRLAPGHDGASGTGLLSPDGTQALISAAVNKELTLVNTSGALMPQALNLPGEGNGSGYGLQAAFAASGQYVYYTFDEHGGTYLYEYNVATHARTPFARWNPKPETSPSRQFGVSVAANGTVLFASNISPTGQPLSETEWFTANAKGEKPLRVLAGYPASLGVRISPNARQVTRAGGHEVTIINLSGTGSTTLLESAGSIYEASAWSPNGSLLIFRRVDNENQSEDIERISTAGGSPETFLYSHALTGAPSYRQASTMKPLDVLARELRPEFYFDTNEKWRPLNVAAFLSEGDNEVCTAQGGTCYPVTGTSSLGKATTTNSYINVRGNYDTEGTGAYRSPYPECILGERQDCDSGPRSSFYYHVQGPHEGYSFIDYWTFYRFNYFGALPESIPANHEGDWEAVTVAPSSDGSTFDFASFSQHGRYYSYLRETLSCDEGKQGSCGTGQEGEVKGTRVSVFPAYGDHANYPFTCNSACFQTESAVPERAHDGSEPWGNNLTTSALLALPAIKSGQWVDWPGRWGNEADGSSAEFPPASPGNQQPHFSEPWASKCLGPVGSKCVSTASLASGPRLHTTSLVARSSLAPLVGTGDTADRASGTLGAANYCANWFGDNVQAVLCDPRVLATALAHRSLRHSRSASFAPHRGTRVGTTAAVAQAVGKMLVPGDELKVHGSGAPRGVLFVRARYNAQVVEVRFSGLVLKRGEACEVRVLRAGNLPEIELLRSGRVKRPDETTRSVLGA